MRKRDIHTRSRIMSIWIALGGFMAVLSATASENLVRDGGFDLLPGSPGSPWTVEGDGTVGAGGSGLLDPAPGRVSARLTASNGQTVSIQQCVPVSPQPGRRFSVSVQSLAVEGGAGTHRIFAAPMLDEQCATGIVSEDPGLEVPIGTPPHSFGELWLSQPHTLPVGTKAVRIRIEVHADPGATRAVDWDDVRLVALNPVDQPTTARYWHQEVEGIPDSAEIDDGFGTSLASGDFDGDGHDDLAIGVPEEDRTAFSTNYIDAGLVHVLYGSPTGLRAGNQTLGALPFLGLQGFARVGAALAAGDINGDGFDDLVVGAPGQNIEGATAAGAIYVSWGSETGLTGFQRLAQSSPEVGNNSEANDRFGSSLSIGDINADGYADVVVGTPGESVGSSGADTGAVYVLYGSADGLQGASAPRAAHVVTQGMLHLGLTAGNQFGYAVLLHDVDSDGHDDLVVGAPFEDQVGTNAGVAYWIPAINGVLDPEQGVSMLPTVFDQSYGASQLFFGASLAGGERRAPGLQSTLLIGAPGVSTGGVTGHGRVYRYSVPWDGAGQPVRDSLQQEPAPPEFPEAFDGFGSAVLVADLDGDGRVDDEIGGSPGEDAEAGSIHVLTPQGVAFRQSDLGGAHEFGDRFGGAMARGNFNGYGGDEIAVALPAEGIGSVAGAGAVVEIIWDAPLPHIFRNGFEDPQP